MSTSIYGKLSILIVVLLGLVACTLGGQEGDENTPTDPAPSNTTDLGSATDDSVGTDTENVDDTGADLDSGDGLQPDTGDATDTGTHTDTGATDTGDTATP